MRYDAATFALYDEVFAESHDFVKRAGMAERLGRFFTRRVSAAEELAAAQAAARNRARDAAHLGKEVGDLRSRMPSGNFSTFEEAAEKAEAARKAARKAQEAAVARESAATTSVNEAQQAARRNKRLALGGAGVGVTGLTAAGVGVPMAYDKGVEQGQANQKRTRNLAFGTGVVAGTAAPDIIRGLGGIARSAGQTGLFPEFQGLR